MKSRRGFLSLIGLGAVAAPAAVIVAKEAMVTPVAMPLAPAFSGDITTTSIVWDGLDGSHSHAPTFVDMDMDAYVAWHRKRYAQTKP